MNAYHSKMISGGRIQVPTDIRKQLGLKVGDAIVFAVENNELRVRSYNESIRRLQERFKKYRSKEGEMSMSEELIADRRREAENE